MTITVTEPTMLAGVDEATYHRAGVRTPGPQTSQSALKLLIAPSTPREFQHRLVTPQEPKRAFDVGHAAHSLVLGVGAEFVRHPDADPHHLWTDGATASGGGAGGQAHPSGIPPRECESAS